MHETWVIRVTLNGSGPSKATLTCERGREPTVFKNDLWTWGELAARCTLQGPLTLRANVQLQFISDFEVTAAQMAPEHGDPWQIVMQWPLCTEVLVVRVGVVRGQTRWQIRRNRWRMLSYTSSTVVAAGVHHSRGWIRLFEKDLKKNLSLQVYSRFFFFRSSINVSDFVFSLQ